MTEDQTFDAMKYRIVRTDHSVIYYNSDGEIHRDNNQPAVILANGYQAWWVNGRLHRDNDKPAVILANGYQAWWVNGKFIK